MVTEQDLSLYIHWPFCKSKCPYCDFNSHTFAKIDHDIWLECYIKELDYYADYISQKNIKTIFFGGGTPSLMLPKTIEKIISHVKNNYNLLDNAEITMEANPTSFELQKFKDFKEAGINRISIGVQSFDENDLKVLGREHSSLEAKKAIEHTANLFDNYSFDLIYARPNQTIQSWQKELEEAVKFSSKHISLYQLTIEKGTKFFKLHREGKIKIPEQELAEDLYLFTKDFLQDYGLELYEISNYAKQNFESKHNYNYWLYKDYLGIGPGAHSRINISTSCQALMNIHSPEKWLLNVKQNSHGLQKQESLEDKEILLEYILMGLRIKDGLDLRRLLRVTRFKNINEIFDMKKLKWFAENDYLFIDETHLRLTIKGWLVYNHLIDNILLGTIL